MRFSCPNISRDTWIDFTHSYEKSVVWRLASGACVLSFYILGKMTQHYGKFSDLFFLIIRWVISTWMGSWWVHLNLQEHEYRRYVRSISIHTYIWITFQNKLQWVWWSIPPFQQINPISSSAVFTLIFTLENLEYLVSWLETSLSDFAFIYVKVKLRYSRRQNYRSACSSLRYT
jgi:hypothetical protein